MGAMLWDQGMLGCRAEDLSDLGLRGGLGGWLQNKRRIM